MNPLSRNPGSAPVLQPSFSVELKHLQAHSLLIKMITVNNIETKIGVTKQHIYYLKHTQLVGHNKNVYLHVYIYIRYFYINAYHMTCKHQ